MAAAALPLFNIIKHRAGAATGTPPLRLLMLWYPFHSPEIFYHPQSSTGGFAAAGSTFNLKFTNSILAPLAPFQSKMILFRGLCYGATTNSHQSNAICFTGSNSSASSTAEGNQTSGSSIEQYLYTRMGQAGSSPICAGLDTFEFSDHLYDSTIAWNAGHAVGMVENPADLFKNLFANFTPPSSSGSSGPSAAQAALLARRSKSLAVAKNGLDAMAAQLPSTSASLTTLQQHQSSLASVISSLGSGSGTVSLASCTPPASSSVPNDGEGTLGNLPGYATEFGSFATLITEAFACDITRFASFKLSGQDNPDTAIVSSLPGFSGYDASNGNFHQLVTHGTTDSATNKLDLQLATYQNDWYTLIAKLLTQLQSTADPYSPSQSIFDNTVVLIGAEGPCQSPGSDVHNQAAPFSDQQFILTGGCGGMFNMGRIIDTRSAGTTGGAPGIPHNALLTNIINAFETNQKAFNPAFVTKPLTGYGDFKFSVSPTSWLTT